LMEPTTTDQPRGTRPPLARRAWRAVAPYIYSMIAALGLLAVTEGLLRAFWPQEVRMVSRDVVTGREVTWGVPDEVIGHRLRPNTSSIERAPEFTAHYVTDAQGFRTDPKAPAARVAAAPASDATRVLIVGDSFAFGYGSPWPHAWANRLQQHLGARGKRVEIVNTGTPGYDTRAEVLLLEREIARFRPDVVLMMFLPNDLFTNLPIERSEASRKEIDQRVREIGTSKSSGLHSVVLAQRVALGIDRAYCSLYLMTPRKEYFTQPLSPHTQGQLKITEDLLVRAREVSERNGAKLVVLSIPQLFQVVHVANGYDLGGVDSRWMDREFSRHAQANGYTWLSTLDHLAALHRAGGDGLYYRFDGHLTPRGNDVVARYLARNDGWMAARAQPRTALASAGAPGASGGSMESF
ncbi:MAG: hypothetical protein KY444_08875, partial [Gemmatimonadetes bacterium]|nr:hypothetical protein [Gemmatimonadota bacterium]